MSESTLSRPPSLDFDCLVNLEGLEALYDSPDYLSQELDWLQNQPQAAIRVYQELACQEDSGLRQVAASRLAQVINLDVDAGIELGSYLVTDDDPKVAQAASLALNQAFIDNLGTTKFNTAQTMHVGYALRLYEKRCAPAQPDPYRYSI